MSHDVSSSKFWDDCYINNDIGWDLGSITPVFRDWCDRLKDKCSIFVPGAGNGYDPLYFASKGHSVTAVDFSVKATENIKKKAQSDNIKINIVNEDIFNLSHELFDQFDYVIEYTCFCAIDRKRRLDYIEIMSRLLKKNGQLVGLFLPLLKDKKEGGPPYSINLKQVINQFSNHFDVLKSSKHPLSIKPRINNEQYIQFKKK